MKYKTNSKLKQPLVFYRWLMFLVLLIIGGLLLSSCSGGSSGNGAPVETGSLHKFPDGSQLYGQDSLQVQAGSSTTTTYILKGGDAATTVMIGSDANVITANTGECSSGICAVFAPEQLTVFGKNSESTSQLTVTAAADVATGNYKLNIIIKQIGNETGLTSDEAVLSLAVVVTGKADPQPNPTPSIAITTSSRAPVSVTLGGSFTITVTLTGGYNVAAQTIHAATTNSDTTFTNNDCALNSQNNYQCTITVNVGSNAAEASDQTITLSNTTASPAAQPSPPSVTFTIKDPVVRIYLPQTGQLYCVPETSYATNCSSGYTSVAGTDGYGKFVGGNYIPNGVAWAYNGSSAVNPSARFANGAQSDGTTACPSGEEVRNDNLTGLMWVQDLNTINSGSASILENALNIVVAMNTSGYCGYTDWRLPNVNELVSLVNLGVVNSSVWLNGEGFSNVRAGYYWSSTTYARDTSKEWDVNMYDGSVTSGYKAFGNNFVWPVRGGQ